MLEDIFSRITENPSLLIIAGVIAIFAVFFLLKKVFKFALGLFFIALIILGFIYFTSEDPSSTVKKVIREGTEKIEQAKEKAQDMKKDLEEIKDKVEESLPKK